MRFAGDNEMFPCGHAWQGVIIMGLLASNPCLACLRFQGNIMHKGQTSIDMWSEQVQNLWRAEWQLCLCTTHQRHVMTRRQ